MSEGLRRRNPLQGKSISYHWSNPKSKGHYFAQATEKRKIHTGFGGRFWWCFFSLFGSMYALCIGNSITDQQT